MVMIDVEVFGEMKHRKANEIHFIRINADNNTMLIMFKNKDYGLYEYEIINSKIGKDHFDYGDE